MFKIVIQLKFSLKSGIHITGDQTELWVDKALMTDETDRNKFVIPATSIKGWLRENAERILRIFNQNICEASNPSKLCGECLICKVFGSPRTKSPLRFTDVKIDAKKEIRTSVSLSRYRKTAYEQRLYTTEVAWVKEFNVRIHGIFTSEDLAKQAIALIWIAAKMGTVIGSSKSRGLGWVELCDFKATCNDVVVGEEEIMKIVRGWQCA